METLSAKKVAFIFLIMLLIFYGRVFYVVFSADKELWLIASQKESSFLGGAKVNLLLLRGANPAWENFSDGYSTIEMSLSAGNFELFHEIAKYATEAQKKRMITWSKTTENSKIKDAIQNEYGEAR